MLRIPVLPRMSRHNRWSDPSRSYDTEVNNQGRYQSARQPERRHLSCHDGPWFPSSRFSARNTWNSPNSSGREQLESESSDINTFTRQQTDNPSYYNQQYGANEWPFSHRYEGLYEPYFISQQPSSAYAPADDYVVPMTTSLSTTPTSSRILETSSTDPGFTSYPQPSVEKQTPPLPEYLEATLEPSTHLHDPTASRKLLILDLNGTLLFRSPHRRRGPRSTTDSQSYSHYHHHDHHRTEDSQISSEKGEPSFDPYADPTVLRPLRPVHLRPFLASFRQYLFHPETRLWLDTMIWSSAQPHSVSDMVERCFGNSKDDLVAVWARDTLGLSKEQYNRKTQTTKDLEKPWAFLSSHKSSDEPKDSEPSHILQRMVHSAHTTLLLDDSPLKAHLQPWNHLCIHEYVAEMRAADMEAAQIMSKMDRLSTYGVTDENVDAVEPGRTSEHQLVDQQNSKKRKRLLKKIAKKENEMMSKRQNLSGEDQIERQDGDSSSENWWRLFDCTLLAVIGVLDAAKQESNVAAWVRQGGLWKREAEAEDDIPQTTNSKEKAETTDLDSDASTSPSVTEEYGSDRKKHRRALAGNDQGLSADLMSSKEGPWFEDELTMSYWIERGVTSLKELNITVDPGVKVS